jgi:hypothetical protein
MDDIEDWEAEFMRSACVAIVHYEQHLRSDDPINTSKGLARAMRSLKDQLPDELLILLRTELGTKNASRL